MSRNTRRNEKKETPEERTERIRTAAYLKWLARTDGATVSDEETQRFWLEAEHEVNQETQ